MNKPINILFFSDTHLGFDLPLNPRIQRRRRGDDFFSNYQLILDYARKQKVDLIVHGGDVFYKSKVPLAIVDKVYEPLLKVAESGIPIFIVPGNHDRSRLPDHLWLSHPQIHVFDEPRTFLERENGVTIALSGFPFVRNAKDQFYSLLHQSRFQDYSADLHFLCLHQTFEGAKVGPIDFTFKTSADNIPGEMTPDIFQAVLSGHIHRAQQLTQTLDGKQLAVPVVYSGSIERTSFAERFEEKYFVTMRITCEGNRFSHEIEYHQLPTRPMVKMEIPIEDRNLNQVSLLIRERLSLVNPDAIVRINLTGKDGQGYLEGMTAPHLRDLSPESMNISLGRDWIFQDQR
jgi:DNA repair exonuclease SbcCD nuclease subunit